MGVADTPTKQNAEHPDIPEWLRIDTGPRDSVQVIEHEPDDAVALLVHAADTIQTRGTERDQPDGERSMARTVAMFNALKGTNLSETDGWDFMECLKMARAQGGAYKADDYTDRIGYAALAAESAAKANAG